MRSFLRVKQDLNLSREERKEHSSGIQKVISETNHFELFKFFYDNLNIIDSKASALLSFNALVLVGVSFWISNIKLSLDLFELFTIFPVIMLIISSLCCLKITYLHWSSTTDFKDMEEHVEELIEVRDKRTIYYRCAWLFSFWSLLLLLLTTAIKLLLKIL